MYPNFQAAKQRLQPLSHTTTRQTANIHADSSLPGQLPQLQYLYAVYAVECKELSEKKEDHAIRKTREIKVKEKHPELLSIPSQIVEKCGPYHLIRGSSAQRLGYASMHPTSLENSAGDHISKLSNEPTSTTILHLSFSVCRRQWQLGSESCIDSWSAD